MINFDEDSIRSVGNGTEGLFSICDQLYLYIPCKFSFELIYNKYVLYV